jgi:hypothetical protein
VLEITNACPYEYWIVKLSVIPKITKVKENKNKQTIYLLICDTRTNQLLAIID